MKSNWKQKNKQSLDGSHQQVQKEKERALSSLEKALIRRDHSVQELKTKLNRYYSPEAINYALEQAEARHWLKSETEIAETASQSYSRKLKSHTYIQQQMQKRGLPTPDLDFSAEQDKINELIKRRFGKADLSDYEQRMKIVRFLSNRGFELRAIKAVIKNVEVDFEES